jgi:peroxiredoxin
MAFGLAVGSCAFIGHLGEAASQANAQAARSWLGVELSPAAPGGRGVLARHVVRGSPAHAAGIRDGDAIVSVGDAAVGSSDEVIRAIGAHPPGAVVRIRGLRVDRDFAVDVTLGRFPGGDQMLRQDKVGARAPAFGRLLAVDGQVPASVDELRGKVVMIDFWMSACAACRFSAPRLSALQAKLGARGLVVIGITDDAVDDAARTAASYGMRFAVGTDESFATQRAYGVTAFPTMFVVDKRGVVRDVMVGFDSSHERDMEALIEKLLAEPAS